MNEIEHKMFEAANFVLAPPGSTGITWNMRRPFSSSVAGFLAILTGAAGMACSGTDTGGQSQLSTRASDEAEQNVARSTVDFAGLKDAQSSQPIMKSVSETADGSAATTISYYTLIGGTNLALSLSSDGPSELVELPRGGSLVLVDAEGSWEATEGTVRVRARPTRLTLVLEDVRLTSETVGEVREGLSGSIVGEIQNQCFVRAESDRPALAGGDGTSVEELTLDTDWASTFCASRRPDTP